MKEKEIIKELEALACLEKRVQASYKRAPEGSIRCEMAHGKYPQYYLLRKDLAKEYPKGKYLRKSESELAKKYAQKEYDERMLAEIRRRQKELTALENVQVLSHLQDVFESLPPAKQRLVEPYVLPDEQYFTEWENKRLNVVNSYPMPDGLVTERGETVRSKSEKMIADKLFLRGIPYKYEAGIELMGKVIFPDFTLLNKRTREEFYFEHFGMMDQPEYCKTAIAKIELYEECGIFLGEKLLVSFESNTSPINMVQIDRLIERYLL